MTAKNDQALGTAGGNRILVTGRSFGAGELDELIVKIGELPLISQLRRTDARRSKSSLSTFVASKHSCQRSSKA